MKYLVLASGGLDSSVLLYKLVREGKDVTALNMYYGQKHAKESEYLEWTCNHLGIKKIDMNLKDVFAWDKSCTLLEGNEDVPEGEYKDQGNIPSTYVPFRNGLFLSVATSVALQLGCDHVVYGAHLDDVDRNAYPDCSPMFYEGMGRAIYEGSGYKVTLSAPYIINRWTKKDVVNIGLVYGKMTKEEFEHTWSCYKGGDKPCGKCATCIDRKAAFVANNVFDID